MNDKLPKFKRHETFSLRQGWLEKGINKVAKNPKCFSKDSGTRIFGLGTNMVKSLRFYLTVSQVCLFNKEGAFLTDLGRILYEYDKYLESNLSWCLIHLNLVSDKLNNPVFYDFFHLKEKIFTKDSLVTYLMNYYVDTYNFNPTKSSVESDVSVLFKTYNYQEITDPENNFNSPLAKFNLLTQNENKEFIKNSVNYEMLPKEIIYYLLSRYGNEFNLDDLLESEISPLLLFNLTKSSLFAILDELRNLGLISIVKTAGLNTIKINKKLSLEDLYREGLNV